MGGILGAMLLNGPDCGTATLLKYPIAVSICREWLSLRISLTYLPILSGLELQPTPECGDGDNWRSLCSGYAVNVALGHDCLCSLWSSESHQHFRLIASSR